MMRHAEVTVTRNNCTSLDTGTGEIEVEASLVDTAASQYGQSPDTDAGRRPMLACTTIPPWINLSGSLNISLNENDVTCLSSFFSSRHGKALRFVSLHTLLLIDLTEARHGHGISNRFL